MQRALAVIEPTETAKTLLREAGELAAGVDAELILVYGTTEEEYNDRREDMAQIPDIDTTYSLDQALDGARRFAKDMGRDVLTDVDVDWEAVGRIGEKAEEVLALADERDCDHIFIAGRDRSPTGKAIFGDDTQRVILDANVPVTVLTGHDNV